MAKKLIDTQLKEKLPNYGRKRQKIRDNTI